MRKRQTFLLTIITSDTGDASLCGRLKVISNGNTFNFACTEELIDLVCSEMEEEALPERSATHLQYPMAPDALAAS